jgi:hypothetical protein
MNPKKTPAPKKDAELVSTELLVSSDHYEVWTSHEPDGEQEFHIEIDSITLHFLREEWAEFIAVIQAAADGSNLPKK